MMVTGKRFRFIKEIAEGGFGKVYLAELLSADGFSRIVAVKLLHSKWSSHDEVVMRTRDEARLLGLIRHQHIVKVEDLTSIEGKCAIVMEYLEGVDLKCMSQHLHETDQTFPYNALFEIMVATASALDAAYNGRPLQGGDPLHVIHRDIKPSNIFVTVNGGAKVLDFGTARANFAEREAKTQALAFGSQGYMAPERMLGEPDTAAADVFSLGVTLYELLAQESFGRIPPRPTKFSTKVNERVASIELIGDDAWNQQVRELLTKMMDYEPSARPSAGELVERFEELSHAATDMGLRKFSRTAVVEAKAKIPEINSGDPLFGQTIAEDLSGVMENVTPNSSPGEQTADVGSDTSQPISPTTSDISDSYSEPGAQSSSKLALIIGLLLLFGFMGLATVGAGAYFLLSGDEEPAPSEEPKALAEPEAKPESTMFAVTVDEVGKDAARAKEVTLMLGADVMSLELKAKKFKAGGHVDGPVSLGSVAAGRYTTTIELKSGKTIKRTPFTVEANKMCEFTFDSGSGKWNGDCQ